MQGVWLLVRSHNSKREAGGKGAKMKEAPKEQSSSQQGTILSLRQHTSQKYPTLASPLQAMPKIAAGQECYSWSLGACLGF